MPKRSFEALPPELHSAIFTELFQETVIAFGFEGAVENQHEPFAILLTCRGLYNAAQPLLKRNITLHFASTNLMLHVLLPMSPEDRGQFGHMRVRGYTILIDSVIYPFNTALCMLSGLELDTLLVEDVHHDGDDDGEGDTLACVEVDALAEADGWRQLLYYTPSSGMLVNSFLRLSPPPDWQRRIKCGDRDGSISLFRGLSNDTSMAAGPHRCNALEMIPVDDWEPCFRKVGDSFSMTVEISKPLLIFAKRTGDYRQTGEDLPECLQELIDEFGGDWSRIGDESGLYEGQEEDHNARLRRAIMNDLSENFDNL